MTDVVAHTGILGKIRLHVEDTGGSGRPVVLIHGWPLTGASWAGQVDALTGAGHRVIRYDRRGFGQSEKPKHGFDYDTLADDLESLLQELNIFDATLVGFSMGGGEVARYVARHGEKRLRSVVFASAVTPYLLAADDNLEGPLGRDQAAQFEHDLTEDRVAFFEEFTTNFFSVDGALAVSEEERQRALALAHQSDQKAALGCMQAWATTDFRHDLTMVTVPTLVIHGDKDAVVPFDGSAKRTHAAIAQSTLVTLEGAPHGANVSHRDAFNAALVEFLGT